MRATILYSLVTVLGSLPLHSQGFAGSWSIPGGNVPITLTLRQNRQGAVTGTLVAQATMTIQARVNGQMFEGTASNQTGRIYIAGQLADADALNVVMAEVDAAGNAQQQTARSFVATRAAGGASAANSGTPGAGDPGPGNRGAGPGGPASPGGVVGSGPNDRQIAQLLMRSAWCYFRYVSAGGANGRSTTERVVFRADGTGSQTTGSESYNSGSNGTAYGNNNGGQQFFWRIQNGAMIVSSDRVQWGNPVMLSITQNSNGYPIITAEGKEYSMCN